MGPQAGTERSCIVRPYAGDITLRLGEEVFPWHEQGQMENRVAFEIHRVLVHVVIANESLKDRHRVLGGFAKLLDPSVALWRSLQSYVGFILISAAATL